MSYRYIKLTYDHTRLPVEWGTNKDVNAFLRVDTDTDEVESLNFKEEWELQDNDLDYIIDKDRKYLKDMEWLSEHELNKHLAMRGLIK